MFVYGKNYCQVISSSVTVDSSLSILQNATFQAPGGASCIVYSCFLYVEIKKLRNIEARGWPGRLSVGGERRSLICASLSPSTHWTSRVRSRGQLEVQSAETAAQEQPDNFNTRRPERRSSNWKILMTTETKCGYNSTTAHSYIPGNLLMSQLSCFLEMLVQLRSRETGCRRIIPLSMRGVMEVQRFRSISVQSLLSQHLHIRKKDTVYAQKERIAQSVQKQLSFFLQFYPNIKT